MTCDASLYTMDYSKLIVPNQKEESISTSNVKVCPGKVWRDKWMSQYNWAFVVSNIKLGPF